MGPQTIIIIVPVSLYFIFLGGSAVVTVGRRLLRNDEFSIAMVATIFTLVAMAAPFRRKRWSWCLVSISAALFVLACWTVVGLQLMPSDNDFWLILYGGIFGTPLIIPMIHHNLELLRDAVVADGFAGESGFRSPQ